MHGQELPICPLARKLTVDFRLLLTKYVTFADTALCGLDRAPATPPITVSGEIAIHLVAWMMNTAAVAKKCL